MAAPDTAITYTRQQLLAALKQVVALQGDCVTLDQFRRETGISSAPIVRLFGSWSGLRQEAGLVPRGKKLTPAMYTHEQICERLCEAALVYGEEITLDQFLQASGISATPIYHLFGSWPALREAAGLRSRLRRGWIKDYRPAQRARQVEAIMASPNPPVNLAELKARSNLTRAEVEAEFGSWEDLCEFLFIETRGNRLELLSDEELLHELEWAEHLCNQAKDELQKLD